MKKYLLLIPILMISCTPLAEHDYNAKLSTVDALLDYSYQADSLLTARLNEQQKLIELLFEQVKDLNNMDAMITENLATITKNQGMIVSLIQ